MLLEKIGDLSAWFAADCVPTKIKTTEQKHYLEIKCSQKN
jgi:hypothetical protein